MNDRETREAQGTLFNTDGYGITRPAEPEPEPKQQPTYFNTTRLRGEELAEATRRAKSQQEDVERFFRRNPGRLYTPWQVVDALKLPDLAINGVRRSITVLTQSGVLVRTKYRRRDERTGATSFCWRLRETARTER